MKFLKYFYIVCFLVLVQQNVFAQKNISNYKLYLAEGNLKGENLIILRQFNESKQVFYLTVNPDNLETSIISAKKIKIKPLSWQEVKQIYKDSPYIKAMADSENLSYSIQDSGITHGFPQEKGITLTIDLCPSHKPLDRIIFSSLISEFQKIEKPVPIALSITGKFMLTHSDDIKWLQKNIQKGDISITWVNHSYNHHYDPKLPLTENFLLEKGTDINFEIIGTEIALIQRGLLPSVFFRFPGLVSDHSVVDGVLQYGLISIGSDAWLAKGQQPNGGSIVLIHGNGNEPLGVNDFIKLLREEKSSVMNKQWLMYDLRESVENEFQNK